MLDKEYRILGVSESDSDEYIKAKYLELKNKYQEERFIEGEVGNNAAKMLTEIENAYNQIVFTRSQRLNAKEQGSKLSEVDALIRSGDLYKAQLLLDEFDERNAEWHYYQSVVFYKKNWINESKKQLEIAIEMDPSVEKYKTALNTLNERVNQSASANDSWRKSGNAYSDDKESTQTVTSGESQLGGESCCQWCCDMIICNTMLNCFCNGCCR